MLKNDLFEKKMLTLFKIMPLMRKYQNVNFQKIDLRLYRKHSQTSNIISHLLNLILPVLLYLNSSLKQPVNVIIQYIFSLLLWFGQCKKGHYLIRVEIFLFRFLSISWNCFHLLVQQFSLTAREPQIFRTYFFLGLSYLKLKKTIQKKKIPRERAACIDLKLQF